jgi:exodeoxyribonuclease VII large subunit
VNRVYSVSQMTAYIGNLFRQDVLLPCVSVSGEVSNVTDHRTGNLFFTIKDASSQMACVMFSSSRRGLAFHMKEGDRVVVTGSVEVYQRDGRYQLYARQIQKEGAGVLYEKFLKLKAELEEMGMFDPMYKQPIPKYVKRLGIVTAPTGAAVQDIRNISLRRNPYIQLILYPALVQGEGAKNSIVRGLQTLDAMHLDCIIVGRGGGSIEDLWAFNEREVAEAVFQCKTPVISAVGHETDTTITDFVADLRAPTPSAAAELAVSDIREMLSGLERSMQRLQLGMEYHVQAARNALQSHGVLLTKRSPQKRVADQRARLDALRLRIPRGAMDQVKAAKLLRDRFSDRLQAGSTTALREKQHALQMRIQRLRGLDPLAKLNQGYVRAEDASGQAISSTDAIRIGDTMQIYVRDGRIDTKVTGTEKLDFRLPEEDKKQPGI